MLSKRLLLLFRRFFCLFSNESQKRKFQLEVNNSMGPSKSACGKKHTLTKVVPPTKINEKVPVREKGLRIKVKKAYTSGLAAGRGGGGDSRPHFSTLTSSPSPPFSPNSKLSKKSSLILPRLKFPIGNTTIRLMT